MLNQNVSLNYTAAASCPVGARASNSSLPLAAKQQHGEDLLRQKQEEAERLERLRAKGYSGVHHEVYSPGHQ